MITSEERVECESCDDGTPADVLLQLKESRSAANAALLCRCCLNQAREDVEREPPWSGADWNDYVVEELTHGRD